MEINPEEHLSGTTAIGVPPGDTMLSLTEEGLTSGIVGEEATEVAMLLTHRKCIIAKSARPGTEHVNVRHLTRNATGVAK